MFNSKNETISREEQLIEAKKKITDNAGGNKSQISFSERLVELIYEKNITQSDISTELLIASSTLSDYINGKKEPKITNLNGLADYFNVSTDYLLGKTDIKSSDPEIQKICNYTGLNEEVVDKLNQYKKAEKAFIDIINKLISSRDFDVVLYDINDYLRQAKLVNKIFEVLDETSELPIVKEDRYFLSYDPDTEYDRQQAALLRINKKFNEIIEKL